MSEYGSRLLTEASPLHDDLANQQGENSTAKSSSPQEWQEITNLNKLVDEVSRFSSPQTKEDFRFVAHGILKIDLTRKTPQDIYNMLYKKFEPRSSSNEEPTVTATIFREVCICAGFGDKSRIDSDSDVNNTYRLENLDRFCLSRSFERQESTFKQLRFRKNLLEIGREIVKCNALEKTVVLFSERERGTHPETIQTSISLFTRLLKKNILKPDDPSSICILEEKFEAAKRELQKDGSGNVLEDTVTGDPTYRGLILQHRNSTLTSNPPTSKENSSGKDLNKQSVCVKKKKCLCGLIVLLVFGALGFALAVFGIYCIPFSFAQSVVQNMVIYRDNAILAARRELSSAFTESVNFTLMLSRESRPEICYYDCTGTSPRTRPIDIDLMRISNPDRHKVIKNQPRLVQFFDSSDVQYASIFMLGRSSFSFSVTGLDHPIELFILKRAVDLHLFNQFFFGSDNSSFRHFVLNESNDYKMTFSVPEFEHESYYCGALVLPPEKENATFQYTIRGFRNVYDLSSTNLNVQCVSILDKDTTCVPPMSSSYHCYILQLPQSHILESICVFVHETIDTDSTFTSARIQTVSTLDNPLFSATISFGFIILLPVVVVLFVILFVWAYRKRNCHYSFTHL